MIMTPLHYQSQSIKIRLQLYLYDLQTVVKT